ncbi:glycosyltransferase family 61 protein [Methylobacterium oryzihabitans]|nr:glycosyltransferase 61 family protein [Methylobacterium oryzihabitans]
MLEFDLKSGQAVQLDDVLKLTHSGRVRSAAAKGARIDVRSMGCEAGAAEPPFLMDSSGLYVVPNGLAYGGLYVEHAGKLLTQHDLMPIYIAAEIASGAFDVAAERRQRTNLLALSTPAILLNSISRWVYGHWLLDIWPRCWSARLVLGKHFSRYKVLVPQDSPAYAFDVLHDVLGVGPQQVVRYDADTHAVTSPSLIAPSLLHNSYCLHPQFAGFVTHMKRHFRIAAGRRERRIFLSRKQYRAGSRSVRRMLAGEADIEALFVSRGFEIVRPEDLGFGQQIALFDDARIVAGEGGSALHNTVFSGPGTVVVSLSRISDVQEKLASACDHHFITVHPDELAHHDGVEVQHYRLSSIGRAIDLAEACAASGGVEVPPLSL